jgi:hypothetical protein
VGVGIGAAIVLLVVLAWLLRVRRARVRLPACWQRVQEQALAAGFTCEAPFYWMDRGGRRVVLWLGQPSAHEPSWELVAPDAGELARSAWIELTWETSEPLPAFAVYRRDLFSGIGQEWRVGVRFALRYLVHPHGGTDETVRRLRRSRQTILQLSVLRVYARRDRRPDGTARRQLALLVALDTFVPGGAALGDLVALGEALLQP